MTLEEIFLIYIQTVEIHKRKNILRFYMYVILTKGDLCFKGYIFIFII